ncbi:TPA: hypothetical protein N0F65_004858 [Lagenidium giganteum]|uniref:Uncharacterized protein n=1 Tax=Lagenidium giganteum TaxID=4803 RepID=A0AAV2Z3J2_9STRA|nr:TPA: hypothetical protein N0F65_004858 [Lagenidium giganteum]
MRHPTVVITIVSSAFDGSVTALLMIPGSLVAPFLPTFLILCASTSSALSCATSPVLMQAVLVQTNRASLVVAQLSVARDHVVPFSKFLLVVKLARGARTRCGGPPAVAVVEGVAVATLTVDAGAAVVEVVVVEVVVDAGIVGRAVSTATVVVVDAAVVAGVQIMSALLVLALVVAGAYVVYGRARCLCFLSFFDVRRRLGLA